MERRYTSLMTTTNKPGSPAIAGSLRDKAKQARDWADKISAMYQGHD